MDKTKKKRILQRIKADVKAILFILVVLFIGFIAGTLVAKQKSINNFRPAAVKVKLLNNMIERNDPELSHMEYLGEFKITYYCCEQYNHICGSGDGMTATGLPVKPGIVAVDPKVVPLGSTVVIDGVEYLAADTGGAIKGNRIDIAVEHHQEALDLGVKMAEVWIL